VNPAQKILAICDNYDSIVYGRALRTPRRSSRRVDGIFLSDFEQGEIGPDLFRHACLVGLEGEASRPALPGRPIAALDQAKKTGSIQH
jgi:hypothetical protein